MERLNSTPIFLYERFCSLHHLVVLDFHQPMHWNLLLDPGMKDSETEEKPAAKKEEAGGKNQHAVSMENRSDVFKDDRKDETEDYNSSPEDQFHVAK